LNLKQKLFPRVADPIRQLLEFEVKNIPRVIDRGRDDGGGATVAAAPAPTMWEAWR